MISTTLERRLRRIEEQRNPTVPLQGTAILVNRIEEARAPDRGEGGCRHLQARLAPHHLHGAPDCGRPDMSRAVESRLAKLEQVRQGRRETHEERLERLENTPPLSEAEKAAMDARMEAEAIAQFGSLTAASAAASAKAERTKDPDDTIEAWALEWLLGRREGRHALA